MMPLRKFVLLFLLLALALLSASAAGMPALNPPVCGASVAVSNMLGRTSQDAWAGWINRLSGEIPVSVNGQSTSILTRLTRSMFTGSDNAQAYEFILQQVRLWVPESQIYQHPFYMADAQGGFSAKNLVVDLPGLTNPGQVVILSAHLDSTSSQPSSYAPGAEDNASGAATLLEALRLMRNERFDATIRFIWFSGEEQGLIGSQIYVFERPTAGILGVINLDMFGYDADNDHCFELHVGTLPASDVIGQCFANTIQSNALPLTFDYLTEQAIGYSDHASFWGVGVGAVEVLENYDFHNLQGGCSGQDRNPNYHKITDRGQYLNVPVGFEIARASMATAANLAGPLGTCFSAEIPQLTVTLQDNHPALSWQALPEANGYRVLRATTGCTGEWSVVADLAETAWVDQNAPFGQTYRYRVEAFHNEGCFSLQSSCESAAPLWPHRIFMPLSRK